VPPRGGQRMLDLTRLSLRLDIPCRGTLALPWCRPHVRPWPPCCTVCAHHGAHDDPAGPRYQRHKCSAAPSGTLNDVPSTRVSSQCSLMMFRLPFVVGHLSADELRSSSHPCMASYAELIGRDEFSGPAHDISWAPWKPSPTFGPPAGGRPPPPHHQSPLRPAAYAWVGGADDLFDFPGFLL